MVTREERQTRNQALNRKIRNWVIGGVGFLALAVIALNTFYIVPEGHVAVVKFTGKADRQENPGFHYKIPFAETIEAVEVRERKNVEEMAAATANQLPITATVSINWTVNKEAAINLFIQYGSLAQFEERVLDPRLRSAAKAAISKFPADQIIRERQTVVQMIRTEILSVTDSLPITITSPQLENIVLPPTYMESILAKEKAREDAARENHKLAQQKLIAQQTVQTAEAERDAIQALADGNAYKVRVTAEAEAFRILTEYTDRAKGVRLLTAELTPDYMDYIRAQKWNGVLPKTILGEGTDILYGIGQRD